jgi:hypothetical protein
MDDIEDMEPTVAIAHVRRARSLPLEANPHPFVYEDLFGKTWAFIHNGNVATSTLQEKIDAGFIGLPIFLYRDYNGIIEPDLSNDTEWYAIALMKYLIAQNNYYWNGDNHIPSNNPPSAGGVAVTSVEDWAIRRVAQMLHIGWAAYHNSSINGILTDGSQLSVISKSNTTAPHSVWYENYPNDHVSLVSNSSSPPVTPPFESMDHLGQVLYTNGIYAILHGMPEDPLFDPQELRVNARGHSAANQKEPAISVDPDSGSFTAVWVSNYSVVGRWYNQMGMAEKDEFTISTNSNEETLGHPAIAHSDNGQIITVVWSEDTPSSSRILGRTYNWIQETHSWNPQGDVFQVAPQQTSVSVSNPTIAYDDMGNYAVAWEVAVSGDNEIHAKAFNGNGTVIMEEQTITLGGNEHEPDIVWIKSLIDCDVFVIVYHKIDGADCYRKIVLLRLEPSQHFVELVEQQPQTGCHASVARLSDTEFFVAYNSYTNGTNGPIRLNYCTTTGNSISLENTATGDENVSSDSRTDIATRRSSDTDMSCYVCYDLSDGGNEYEIHCARGEVTEETFTFVTEQDPINQYHENDQRYPVIAIASHYPIGNSWYSNHSTNEYFEARRMILWQTWGQDTTVANWGIAGQFRGIYNNLLAAWDQDDNYTRIFLILADLIEESTTISDPVVYMVGNVDVPAGATLTFASGVTIYAAPGCSLRVAGGLVASGCQFTMLEPPARWGGIFVTGSTTLNGCTIDGATTGITTKAATALMVDGCAIQGNGVGIYIYAPSGAGTPEISNCIISNNEAEGISLFSTKKTNIHDCPDISSNGKDGILLNDSYAIINHNHFTGNIKYGVDCYGSSPTLYCNSFSEDSTGEMYLVKKSYPVLWSDNGQDGGSNTFVSTDRTLITMIDSYPIVVGGLNRFTIYGSKGFYMADMSDNVPKHDVTKNEWSQTPPPASTFFPKDYAYWGWDPPQAYGDCGTAKGSSSNAAQMLFEQGYTAEMAGNTAVASTNYMATIAQYTDSSWAQVSAVRLFENQRQIGSAYSDLGTYYATVETNYPEDTCLVETVQDLGTRTLVEAAQYPPALSTYEQIMTDPPSLVDSAYAAVDYAITVMREQYDSLYGGLCSMLPVVSAETIRDLMQALHQVIPPVPEANHQNYVKPPESYVLEQNYPNPFNATTTLRYAVPSSGLVRLTIYNILGQKVATLVDGHQDVGYHSVNWNGANLSSGVYIYQLQVNGHTLTHKMLLLK